MLKRRGGHANVAIKACEKADTDAPERQNKYEEAAAQTCRRYETGAPERLYRNAGAKARTRKNGAPRLGAPLKGIPCLAFHNV